MSTAAVSSYILRTPTEDDWDAIFDVDQRAFNQVSSPEVTAAARAVLELDRFLIAEDPKAPPAYGSGTLVGQTAIYSLSMTVPGGPRPVAGVTWVAVLPTHRRRGILTALMRRQLDGLHEAGGEAVAALWASEAAIYGRFGYGAASRRVELTIPRSARALSGTPTDPSLQVRYVEPAESVPLTQGVYDLMRLSRPGVPARTGAWRERAILDFASERNGASPLRCVMVTDHDGAVRAYARYATTLDFSDGTARGQVRVREAEGADPAAYATLWRFLCDQDLTDRVIVENRPVDDPLLHLLTDPRAALPALRDALFVRLVDVDRALEQRTYGAAVDVVLDVSDPVCPWNARRWRLSADETGASCLPTSDRADLTLSTTELGAAYLGGTTLAALAGAGRVVEHRTGALAAASRALAGVVEPWCPFIF